MVTIISDFDCPFFQWRMVPGSYNLGDDPNSCIRVDTELAPTDMVQWSPPQNTPWSTRKLLVRFRAI